MRNEFRERQDDLICDDLGCDGVPKEVALKSPRSHVIADIAVIGEGQPTADQRG